MRTIPGCHAVGVTLWTDGKAATRAATGGLVYEVDTYQYEIGQGPCLQAVRDRQVVEIKDTMEREGCAEDEAFERLRRFSQDYNQPLRQVVGQVVAGTLAPGDLRRP